jgi:hypothetical protein
VITVIVVAMATLCALEAVLGLVLLGWGLVGVGAVLRRHPDGAAGGLREFSAGAGRVWPGAKASSQIAGRRVIQGRPGRWILRAGRASAAGAYAAAAGRVRQDGPGSPCRAPTVSPRDLSGLTSR